MLTWLGLGTIALLLVLILRRITSVVIALTLVPVAAAIAGGFAGQIGTFAMEGIRGVVPVAVMLAFAVVYFGVMNDAGLFEPVIRRLVRLVHRDPVRISVGAALVAMVTHLDGAGASTFMVTVPAMLPLYQRMGMSPLALTCVAALAAGTMNMLPWGGPAMRAAAALQVSPSAIFVPVLPAMAAGLVTVVLFAAHVGRGERARLAGGTVPTPPRPDVPTFPPAARTSLWYFNASLTLLVVGALFLEVLPLPVVFVIASAVALLVNFPAAEAQRERLAAHAGTAMLMVTTILAAGVFTGILSKSGMLASMSQDLVRVLPDVALRHLPVVLAVTSMPLSLAFDPDSFYFGLLPILASASEAAGGGAVEVGRAAVLGQMTTGFPVSPLTPSTFLLVGLAGVDFADHQRRTLPYAFAITLVMTVVALLAGAIGV